MVLLSTVCGSTMLMQGIRWGVELLLTRASGRCLPSLKYQGLVFFLVLTTLLALDDHCVLCTLCCAVLCPALPRVLCFVSCCNTLQALCWCTVQPECPAVPPLC